MSKLARVLVGEDMTAEAREALRAAHDAQIKIKIEPVKTSLANATIMTAMIEEVLDTELIITQPVIGGVPRPLVTGEQLRLSFTLKLYGHVIGEADVLGRYKIPSGGGAHLHGYRLTIPLELFNDDRRESGRASTTMNLAREVELYRERGNDPIRGIVQNLSLGGMQIRTHDSPEPPLRPAERVRVVVHLPAPVGKVNRMVTIARMAGNKNPRHRVIGIAFEREIEGLRQLLTKSNEKK